MIDSIHQSILRTTLPLVCLPPVNWGKKTSNKGAFSSVGCRYPISG